MALALVIIFKYMNKPIPITLGILGLLIAGIFVGFQIGDTVTPIQLEEIDFNPADIQFLKENVEFINEVTFDEETGEEIIGEKTGLRVPIKYNFPVATTTGYVIEEIDGKMEMNFDGYNNCRGKGKTKDICLSELTDDIQSNIEAFQLNIKQELKELKEKLFQKEIDLSML